MEKTAETIVEKGQKDSATVYEVSYLLLPSLNDADVEANVASLKSLVEAQGGTLISDENPVLIDLAYSITKVVGVIRHKSNSGHFGWMKFELSGEAIENVKKALDASETIMRYLIIKTVRENTLLTGKMTLKKEEKMRRDDMEDEIAPAEVEAEAEPASVEEIDKSIDELVIA